MPARIDNPGTGWAPEFQLRRLILIDSYSPGRVEELPLDADTVLTGRNGTGKTTLLQLIPLFWGERPSRLVGREPPRLDFAAYYLPRITSYICYEYVRRAEPRMVVIWAQDGKRRYRFVRAGYRPELFIIDGVNIVQARDLYRHFQAMGIESSRAIESLSEYRAIILGQPGRGGRNSEHRQLVADYAFVGAGQHLTHLEKIVSSMFRRSADFDELQSAAASCIDGSESELALVADRERRIDALERQQQDYQRNDLPGKAGQQRDGAAQAKQAKETQMIERLATQCDELAERIKGMDKRVPLNKVMEADKIVQHETERKTITQLIKVVAYRSESCLASLVEPLFARSDDEVRAFLKTVFRLPGDIVPDHQRQALRVRLYGLANNRSQQALIALCDCLNAQQAIYPGTDLRLVFEAIQSH